MLHAAVLALVLAAAAPKLAAPGKLSAWPPPPPVDFARLPWAENEALTYQVAWGMFYAAEGTFVARHRGGRWSFRLTLGSRGMVEDYYPFRATCWSVVAPGPWRSLEYGELRFEPARTVSERTRIDYAARTGTRELRIDKKTHTFHLAEDSLDDVGSMLYHLRAIPWKPGDHYVLHVYESDSEKEALAQCQAVEKRAFGAWPAQSLLRVQVLPGMGTHHRGGLMLWLTNDERRLPVHAELEFRYGSFTIDLVKAPK